jgi:hypothetical protein
VSDARYLAKRRAAAVGGPDEQAAAKREAARRDLAPLLPDVLRMSPLRFPHSWSDHHEQIAAVKVSYAYTLQGLPTLQPGRISTQLIRTVLADGTMISTAHFSIDLRPLRIGDNLFPVLFETMSFPGADESFVGDGPTVRHETYTEARAAHALIVANIKAQRRCLGHGPDLVLQRSDALSTKVSL